MIGRALFVTSVLWFSVSIPLPSITSQLFQQVREPVAVFVGIVYIGKLLYDTLFYDRYL